MIIKLKEILIQDTDSYSFTDMQNEKYITVSAKGRGAYERVIKDNKWPLPFVGYRAKAGQLIMSKIGANDGAFGIVPTELHMAAVSKDFPIFNIDQERINVEYLRYLLRSRKFLEQIKRNSHGATLRRIREETFLSLSIDIPEIGKQRNIVSELRILEEILNKSESQLDKLNNLIKARFVEMFGDPKLNNLGLQQANFEDVIKDNTKFGYKLDSSSYKSTGEIQIIDQGQKQIAGFTNQIPNKPPYSNLPCIIFGDHTEIFKYVDELFYLGADGTKILNISTDSLLPRFVHEQLKMHYSCVGGYSRHFKYLKEITILVPKLERQMEFVAFVSQVDKSKFAVQKSLEKTQLLFDSLMQEYFG